MPLSLDEIQSLRANAVRTHSVTADDDFVPTSVDDLFESAECKEQGSLAQQLPQKIVFESRNAFRDSVRHGETEEGVHALKRGLEKLSGPGAYKKTPSWISGKIELLSDLERHEDARELLSSLRSGPTLQTCGDAADLNPDDPNTWHKDYVNAEKIYDLAIESQDWEAGRVALAGVLEKDPDYFKVESREDQFGMCGRLLDGGLLEENLALEEKDESIRLGQMEKALRLYTEGCQLTELFRTHLEHPEAKITGFDHARCSNLFFSAARICIYLSESEAYHTTPQSFDCKPAKQAFTGQDWKHQALDFLEMGRSRALFDSIIRHEALALSRKRKLSSEMSLIATEHIHIKHMRIKKQPSADPDIYPHTPPLIPPSDSAYDSDPLSDPEITPEGLSPHLRARLLWKRNFPDFLDPLLNATVPMPTEARKFSDMLKKIPPNTAVVVYGLASQCPQGLIMLVLTERGIEKASWRTENFRIIKQQIETLQHLMDIEHKRTKTLSDIERLKETDTTVKYLSELLVLPFEACMVSKKNLVIVPSGDLAHVPWTLLTLQREATFLLAVTAAPSFSIWHRLHTRSKTSKIVAASKPKISVITNSPWENDKLRTIPYSRVEAVHIARTHGEWPIQADKSNRTKFENQAKSAQILHVSAHGTFNYEEPFQSRIHLFDGVSVVDWSKLSISAELVVFSACSSSHSRVFDSGGSLSFAHAVLGTGTFAFIGTLWPVHDAATLLIMMLFYEGLQKGLPPADALRASKLSMRGLSPDDLSRLAGKLEEMAQNPDVEPMLGDFVVNPLYWIKGLKAQNVEIFREPRCWAAFILTGYGHVPVYRN